MLLDLRRGFRVLCAHVAVVGSAGCQRDDAAAGRSRSSQAWPGVARAMTEAAKIGAECWMHQKVDAMSSTQQHDICPHGKAARLTATTTNTPHHDSITAVQISASTNTHY